MTKSKKIIFSLDFSYVNLSLGWNSLRSFQNMFKFSSESVQTWTKREMDMHLIKTTCVAVFVLISIGLICIRKVTNSNTFSSNFMVRQKKVDIASPNFLKQVFENRRYLCDKQSFLVWRKR